MGMGLKTCGCCGEKSVCSDQFVLPISVMSANPENAANPVAGESEDWPAGIQFQKQIDHAGESAGFSTNSLWWQYLDTEANFGLANRDFVAHTHVTAPEGITFELDTQPTRFYGYSPAGNYFARTNSGVHSSFEYNCPMARFADAPLSGFSVDGIQATLDDDDISGVAVGSSVKTSISSLSELVGKNPGARIWFTVPELGTPPQRHFDFEHDRGTCVIDTPNNLTWLEYDSRFVASRTPLIMRGWRYLPELTGSENWRLEMNHSNWPLTMDIPVNLTREESPYAPYSYSQTNFCSVWETFPNTDIPRAAVVWGSLFPHIVLTTGWYHPQVLSFKAQFYKPEFPWPGRGTMRFIPDGEWRALRGLPSAINPTGWNPLPDETGILESNWRANYGQLVTPSLFPPDVTLTLQL